MAKKVRHYQIITKSDLIVTPINKG